MHVCRTLITQPAVLLHRLIDDFAQLGRESWIELFDRGRLAIPNCSDYLGKFVSREGQSTRLHLVEHTSQREDVRAGINLPAGGLLRGHIGDGSHSRAGASQSWVDSDGQ